MSELEPEVAEQQDLLLRLVAYRTQVVQEIAAALDASNHADAARAVRTMAEPPRKTVVIEYAPSGEDVLRGFKDSLRRKPKGWE